MAIEVRIPTILRTHTGGSKTVEGSGDTLAALVDDLDSKHPGLKGRLVTDEGTQGVTGPLDGLGATGVRAQDGRDPDLDGHGVRFSS